MTARHLRAMLGIVILTIGTLISIPASTLGQISWCASSCYTVNLLNIPATCFPLCIHTYWGGGTFVWPSLPSQCYTAPGIYTECTTLPPPIGTPLDSIVICSTPLSGTPGTYPVSCSSSSCTYCVGICTSSSGCLVIKVVQGSCPSSGVLPCP
jgi:hypothetical protein